MTRPFLKPTGTIRANADAVAAAFDVYTTQFGDLSTVNRNTIVDVESHYPLSQQANITSTTNASITSGTNDSEIQMQTNANATASATLETAELGRYTAGFVAEAGIGARIPQMPTGNQEAIWGYFDNDNGFYFGVDSDGVFVERNRDGVKSRTYQENWNIDKMNGSPSDEENPSNITLDISEGLIYRITFAWYGYGEIRFDVIASNENGKQEPVPVHREVFTGETSIKNPNLPVSTKVSNNGTASSFTMFVGGRQFAIFGDTNTNRRIKSERVLNKSLNGTTWTPLISVRRKANFNDVKIDFLGFDIIPSDNVVVQIREDVSLTGATFGTPTGINAGETALETDRVATAVNATSGRQRFQNLLTSGGGQNQAVGGRDDVELRVRRQDIVTIMARKVSGQGGSASCVIRWKEEW